MIRSNANWVFHPVSSAIRFRLFDLVQPYGQDSTHGLAAIMNDKVGGGLNSGAEMVGERLRLFNKAIQEYQAALLKLRDAYQQPDKAAVRTARDAARQAFESMQTRFHSELSLHSTSAWARQRNPLMNFERANNIARSRRSVVKLHVSDHSKVLGSGITALDFGSRVGEIHTEYKAGGDWQRRCLLKGSGSGRNA